MSWHLLMAMLVHLAPNFNFCAIALHASMEYDDMKWLPLANQDSPQMIISI